MREPLVILGAGVAGLGAAYHLDGEAPVYEQRPSVGGLCAHACVEGFRFDVVPHVLHFRDESLRGFIERLLEGQVRSYQRHAGIFSHGRITRYPFQGHLFGLPEEVIETCLTGRLAAARCGGPDTTTFNTWIRSTFGDGIATHFLLPYNTKFWTLSPSELTCEWIDALVPVPTYEEMLRGARCDDPAEYGYNVKFWYPTRGGLGAILDALVEQAPRLHVNKRLTRLDTSARRLQFADGQSIEYDKLLWSIPLPELSALLDPFPVEVARALQALRWTSLTVVHLGVRGPAAVALDWVYVPDETVSFYRVGFPSRYAPDAAPEGCHIISAEISHSPWRAIDQTTLVPRVIAELRKLKLLRPDAEILTQVSLELRYGYPIYDHQYSSATTVIRDYLKQQGIVPLGRFGSWRYLSMEDTLLDGQRAAMQVTHVV